MIDQAAGKEFRKYLVMHDEIKRRQYIAQGIEDFISSYLSKTRYPNYL